MDRLKIIVGIFVFLTALATSAHAVEVRFENKPELGLPDDAREQRCEQAGSLGNLKTVISRDSIRRIKIRYFNPETFDQAQVKTLIERFFEDKNTQVYCFPAWANLLMEPAIEGVAYYDSFNKGRLLIWGFQAVLQKPGGDWLFILFPKFK